MFLRTPIACALALGAYTFASQAFAHATAGNRIFPATLGIDDPGVSDELALPTISYTPQNPDAAHEFDINLNYAKRITDNLAISVGDGWTHLKPGGAGYGNLDTALKYQFYVNAPHEFMASLGVDESWAHTGAKNFSDPFNTVTPSLYWGKGFGDLPTSLNFLRPLAMTSQFGISVPGQRVTNNYAAPGPGLPAILANAQQNPTFFNWGYTLQYSLPYLNANVKQVDSDFAKHLVPLVEFAFQTPIGNAPVGARQTTGNIQPGVVYMADKWQLAVEALVPVNNASGKRAGAIAELHFFLDDIYPNSIGKPLFN